jgi:hypothetical protein
VVLDQIHSETLSEYLRRTSQLRPRLIAAIPDWNSGPDGPCCCAAIPVDLHASLVMHAQNDSGFFLSRHSDPMLSAYWKWDLDDLDDRNMQEEDNLQPPSQRFDTFVYPY